MTNLNLDSPMVKEYESEILLNPVTLRNYENKPSIEVTTAKKLKWAKEDIGRIDLKLKNKVVLSAANTRIVSKGWMEVISCRNVFPTNPSVEFVNDRSDKFGGKIYFYLENAKPNTKLQFTIRIGGYTSGGAIIRIGCSTPTQYSLSPINVNGSMNLVLGNIMNIPSNSSSNLALITLEVQFNTTNFDLWSMYDCSVEEIE